MKKSKVIVPALGLLLLSTAASVSGTVAWFTANRTYEAEAGEFSVVNTKDNLNVHLISGLGTTVNNAGKSVSLASSDYKLTDASYDHVNKAIVAPNETGQLFGKVVALESATFDDNATTGILRETNVYSAFTWEMDFALSFGAVTRTTGLFFNAATSSVQAGTSSTIEDTAKGFRMAFVPTALGKTFSETASYAVGDHVMYSSVLYRCKTAHTGAWNAADFVDVSATDVDAMAAGVSRVWADLQSGQTESVNNVRFIDSNGAVVESTTLASKATDYTSPVLMDSTYNTAAPANGAAGAVTTANNYLGTFTFNANKTVHICFKIVVWFEGTDPTMINEADTVYETVKSSLRFGAANLAA